MKTLSEQNALPRAGFMPTTHWSVIRQAARLESTGARQALESLCRAYWYPLYAFLRRDGKSAHEAQDLTQGFFAHLLGQDRLAAVEEKPGLKFRTWLLASLRHYATSQWRRENAQMRGGGATIISIDAENAEDRYGQEPPDPVDPAKLYERKWVLELLQRVLARLEEQYAGRGRREVFAALQPFVMGGDDAESHKEIAARLGMKAGAVAVAVSRLRERYQQLLREEIAQTVDSHEEIEEELRSLATALA
jgi:RNA polymerase sigma-70 factor (ECF subfamily)